MHQQNLLTDSFNSLYLYFGIPGAILIFLTLQIHRRYPHRPVLPPSPGRSYPIIGHLAIVPKAESWLAFMEWGKKLGPIYRLNLAGKNVLILCNHQVAADLLDRRSAIYSNRANNIVAGKIMTGGLAYAFLSHTELWKRMRRASQEALSRTMVNRYHYMMETEAYLILHQIIQNPLHWDDHLRRASSSLFLSVLYGTPTALNSTDPNIVRVNRYVEETVAAAAPGAFLVEYFTWMEHLPRWMCKWRRHAEGWFQTQTEMFDGLYGNVKRSMFSGKAVTSVASTLIENEKKYGLSDREATWCLATNYVAGAETSSSTMAWFIMSMVLNPKIQKRGQEELDGVVGRDHLPKLADIPRLPYIQALVKEILRWRPIAPLGLPHQLNVDDDYQGLYIPKDTIVVANAWAMNHDESVWGPDANLFRPERHLDDKGNLLNDGPSHVSFGFGRRICPGKYMANDILYIQVACILWAFNIVNPEGALRPDPNSFIDNNLNVRPKHYEYLFELRTPTVREMIAQTLEFREQPTSKM
ncbi:hypothetical protein D9758_017439 [Tetrapyrgos nigripes]|uniref:Cytochrome P450 n=1 Tax=Tetrapyrgos nigripes TaxID=182062 RepID=A0A8H5C5Q6_9AGAR|nr:hypothetical protein D9758_017439 [Tetrapyrgos nigripes]